MKGIGIAAAAAACVTALLDVLLWGWLLAGRALAVQARDQDDPSLLDVAALVTFLLTLVNVMGLLIAGILTIVWSYRARKNIDAFPEAVTTLGAGWSIGGWLIPFANLVLPYRVVANVARESQGRAVTPAVVKVWWAAWVAYAIIERLVSRADSETYESLPTFVAGPADYQRYVDYYGSALGPYAIVVALIVLAAITFTRVVWDISTAQQDRIAKATPAIHAVPGMPIPAPPATQPPTFPPPS